MNTKRKGLLQKVFMIMLVLCLVCGNGLMALADEAVASSMRLTKTEGTVSVTNKNGRDMGTMADMKLFNGYHLSTEQKSYAWMNLDDHKLIKLDAVSEAEIQKKGKDLEVLLNSGNLLFNVSENLKADETLNIRTSTMVTGIRGTCGWVKVIDSSRTQVYILEGQVQCYVMDPVTGQYKSIMLRSGETAEFVVYDQTRVGDKCDILVNRFSEKDIPGFVAVELLNNSDLRDRITGATNLDMNWIFNNASGVLVQDQNTVEQKFAPVNDAVQKQEKTVVKNPLFGEDEDDGDNGGGGGNGTVTPPDEPDNPPLTEDELLENIKDPVDLYMENDDAAFLANAENLELYLGLDQISNINIYGADETFVFDRSIIIDSGKTVTFHEGVDVQVNAGQTLSISGTMKVTDGDVINNGSISNYSSNTLDVTGKIQNTETGSIDNIGRIAVTGMLENSGSLFNSGEIDGSVKALAGYMENQPGGTITEDLTASKMSDTVVGEVVLNGAVPTDNLYFDGGTVEVIGIANGLSNLDEIGNGHLVVSDGSAFTSVSVASTQAGLGKVTVNAGGTIADVTSDGGEINLNGGKINTIGSVSPAKGIVNVNGGTLGTVTLAEGTRDNSVATLNMKDGTITQINGAKYAVLNISGGNVENSDLEFITFNNSETNPTVTVNEMTGTLEIENGVIKSMSISDTGTLEVNGGTIESLTATGPYSEITNGNGTPGSVLGIPVVKLTNGTVDKLEMEMADVTISDSTVTDQLIVEDSDNNRLTFAEGTTLGALTVKDSNGVTLTENVTVEGDVTLNGQGQLNVSGATIKGSILVNEDAGLVVDSGEVMNGIQMNGTDASSVTVYGGEIHAGTGVPAIQYNAGTVSISADAKIMAEDAADFIILGENTTRYNILLNGETIDPTTFPVCRKEVENIEESESDGESKKDEVILKRYAASFMDALERPQDGDYLMMLDDVSYGGNQQPDIQDISIFDYYVGEDFVIPETPIAITLDLNDHEFNVGTGYRIQIFGAQDESTDVNSLTICDSGADDEVGQFICSDLSNGIYDLPIGAELTLEGINFTVADNFVNYGGNITLKDTVFNTSAELYNQSGYIEFNGGTCKSTYFSFIHNVQGTIRMTNSAHIEIKVEEYDGQGGITTAGGNVYLGVSEDGDISEGNPVTVNMTLSQSVIESIEDPSDALIFIRAGSSQIASNDEFEGVISFGNVTIDVNYGQAVNFDSSIHQLIIGQKAVISSDSSRATIEGRYGTFDNSIIFNGGEIINTYDGSALALLMDGASEEEKKAFGNMLAPSTLKTVLKSKVSSENQMPSIVSTATSDGMIEDYDLDAGKYTFTTEGTFYCVTGISTESSSYSLARNISETPGEREDVENMIEATASNATSSNASGTPTPSKSAIPMAVAMLAGLMAIAPKLFEDSEYKNRKER